MFQNFKHWVARVTNFQCGKMYTVPNRAFLSGNIFLQFPPRKSRIQAQRPHNSDSVFTTSEKFTLNVHQITTSDGTFLSLAHNSPKHAILNEKFEFPRWGWVLLSHRPTPRPASPSQAFWSLCISLMRNSGQIRHCASRRVYHPTTVLSLLFHCLRSARKTANSLLTVKTWCVGTRNKTARTLL